MKLYIKLSRIFIIIITILLVSCDAFDIVEASGAGLTLQKEIIFEDDFESGSLDS